MTQPLITSTADKGKNTMTQSELLQHYENNPADLQIHTAAELEPGMTTEEFGALKTSISSKGLLEPLKVVWDDDDQVFLLLDGRHRKAACV